MSWHTMLEFEPPLVGCVVSNRNFSFETLAATREGVVSGLPAKNVTTTP
jgi:flavin reductase (DIM6/NTAB) family NADH-FMN oxidoreductase RutF